MYAFIMCRSLLHWSCARFSA